MLIFRVPIVLQRDCTTWKALRKVILPSDDCCLILIGKNCLFLQKKRTFKSPIRLSLLTNILINLILNDYCFFKKLSFNRIPIVSIFFVTELENFFRLYVYCVCSCHLKENFFALRGRFKASQQKQ